MILSGYVFLFFHIYLCIIKTFHICVLYIPDHTTHILSVNTSLLFIISLNYNLSLLPKYLKPCYTHYTRTKITIVSVLL